VLDAAPAHCGAGGILALTAGGAVVRLSEAERNPPIASIGTIPYIVCDVTVYYRSWYPTRESDARPSCGTGERSVQARALGTFNLCFTVRWTLRA
jgi:hypothetical protein